MPENTLLARFAVSCGPDGVELDALYGILPAVEFVGSNVNAAKSPVSESIANNKICWKREGTIRLDGDATGAIVGGLVCHSNAR